MISGAGFFAGIVYGRTLCIPWKPVKKKASCEIGNLLQD